MTPLQECTCFVHMLHYLLQQHGSLSFGAIGSWIINASELDRTRQTCALARVMYFCLTGGRQPNLQVSLILCQDLVTALMHAEAVHRTRTVCLQSVAPFLWPVEMHN